jgi:cytochrome c
LDRVKAGPPLRGVYGRKAGAMASFTYSDALKKSQITWSAESLDRWLTDPDVLVPENDMEFQVVNPEERKQIIGYLKQISARR